MEDFYVQIPSSFELEEKGGTTPASAQHRSQQRNSFVFSCSCYATSCKAVGKASRPARGHLQTACHES